MPSSLTINVSAGASALVPTNAQQQSAAERAQRAITPDQTQIAKASQAAAEKVSAGTKVKSKDEGFQIPKRVEPNHKTYGKKKKPGKNASAEEAEESPREQADGQPLDVEA